MIHDLFIALLGCAVTYLWWQVELLKKKLKSNFGLLSVIVEFLKPTKEIAPHEIRVVISQNRVSIGEIKKELSRIENLALRALDLVGTIIRNSKEHPVSNDAIDKFIQDEGLLKDE